MNDKTYYTFDLLKKIIERDECVVNTQKYTSISSRDVKVDFTCKCSKIGNKSFRKLYETGAFCIHCMNIKTKQKIKQTNQNRYGVDNPFLSKDIQQKCRKTMLEKYGVEHPLQYEQSKEKAKTTNIERYGVENAMQSKEFQEKAKKTNLEMYGVEYTFQSEDVKDKIKNTMIERYGVDNPMKSDEVKEKSKQTNIEKYGFESHNQSILVKERKKQTTLVNFGVENPMYSETVKEKLKLSNLEKYNVENPMQVPEICEKSQKNAFKLKNYVFPCGQICSVQGYEPFALDILVEQGYTSKDIETDKNKVPEIWYEYTGANHRYFPDIYIPNKNIIIEVKSTWTYEKEKERNELKAEACKNLGYLFEFWVFDSRGNKLPIQEYEGQEQN